MWLEKYINFSTKERSRARIVFVEDVYKLLKNAIYRKTVENVENRCKIEFF